MNRVRVLVIGACCALGLSSVASASFDLALVTDAGTNTVHRIDPMNRVYLGSFGGGALINPRGVVVNQAMGHAYVLDSVSRVSTWNYNTGAFISSFNVTISGAKFLTGNSDGTLNITGASSVRRISTAGSALVTYNRNGTLDTQQAIRLSDGTFHLSTRTGVSSVSLERFNYATGAYLGGTGWLADRLVPIPAIGTANTFNAYVSTSTVILELDNIQGAPSHVGETSTTLLDTVAGVGAGHGGMMFVVGRDRLTPARGGILAVDMNTLTAGPTLIGTSNIVNPTGMAVVVAPEPGTMIALGGGLAILLRRRKRG